MRPVLETEKNILAGLSETQKKIIKILMEENETNVPKLSKQLGLALPTIRKATGVLRDKGLVIQRGKARETIYSLDLPRK